MILRVIGRLKNTFQTCCSSLKAFVLTRHTRRTEGKFPANPPFADKNTFYAWQRNHMANERTFLSWCRTGLSLLQVLLDSARADAGPLKALSETLSRRSGR